MLLTIARDSVPPAAPFFPSCKSRAMWLATIARRSFKRTVKQELTPLLKDHLVLIRFYNSLQRREIWIYYPFQHIRCQEVVEQNQTGIWIGGWWTRGGEKVSQVQPRQDVLCHPATPIGGRRTDGLLYLPQVQVGIPNNPRFLI